MREEIQLAAAQLIGNPLWGCGRAADMATFQFGPRTERIDRHGKAYWVGEFALHVQCPWRIVREDGVVVGSQDLYYPAEYDPKIGVPEEFDWNRDPTRCYHLLSALFDNETREFIVQAIDVGSAGGVRVLLNHGLALEVFPCDSLEREHWRLFKLGSEEKHFVVTGNGIES